MQQPDQDTVYDWLEYHSLYNGDQLAAVDIDSGRRLDYRTFNDRATRLATGLASRHGVSRGDRVVMLAHNSSDIFETLFACWKLGAIFVPLNWRLAPAEIDALIEHSAPQAVLCDAEFLDTISNVQRPSIIRRPGDDDCEYAQLIAASPPDARMPELVYDDRNMILYTSGTTGAPKGVIYTYRMTMNIVVNGSLHGDLNRMSRTLTYLPLFHTAGLNGCALPLFHFGGTLFIMQRWDAEATLRYLQDPDLGITHCIGVPTNYIMMAELPGFESARFPNLHYLGIGSAPVPIGLLETWDRKGVDLVQSYGMTEAFCVSLTPMDIARAKLGSAGHALMHVSVQIGDKQGNELPRGTVGEVQLKGPGVTPGYWREPEHTAAAFVDGWFRTGDAARMDADGTLYIVDRFKDMYISGGENVYPSEVENVISTFPEVRQVAIIGMPDPQWGEIGLALIVLRAGYNLAAEQVLARCREQLAPYKAPKKINFINSLPLSPQGKVLKRELRKMYQQEKN